MITFAMALSFSAILLIGCLEGPSGPAGKEGGSGKDGKDGLGGSGNVKIDSLKFSLFDLYLFSAYHREPGSDSFDSLSARAAARLDSLKDFFKFDSIETGNGRFAAITLNPDYVPAHWEAYMRIDGHLKSSPVDSTDWWVKETVSNPDGSKHIAYYSEDFLPRDPQVFSPHLFYYENKGFDLESFMVRGKGYGIIYYWK